MSSIFLSSFFPRLFSAVAYWMSTILPHIMWPQCEFGMQVSNVLHVARWKYRTQKSPEICHLGTIAQLFRAVFSQLRHVSTIGKKLVKQQYLLHTTPGELSPLTAEVREFGARQQFSTDFAAWLHYCSDVTYQRPTKLCMMFGRLLGCHTIYTCLGALAAWRNFARCKIHFTSKSCILLYWQRYCTALQQRASAKLCGMVQGRELQNLHKGCHLYLAERPTRWASAHILVSLF